MLEHLLSGDVLKKINEIKQGIEINNSRNERIETAPEYKGITAKTDSLKIENVLHNSDKIKAENNRNIKTTEAIVFESPAVNSIKDSEKIASTEFEIQGIKSDKTNTVTKNSGIEDLKETDTKKQDQNKNQTIFIEKTISEEIKKLDNIKSTKYVEKTAAVKHEINAIESAKVSLRDVKDSEIPKNKVETNTVKPEQVIDENSKATNKETFQQNYQKNNKSKKLVNQINVFERQSSDDKRIVLQTQNKYVETANNRAELISESSGKQQQSENRQMSVEVSHSSASKEDQSPNSGNNEKQNKSQSSNDEANKFTLDSKVKNNEVSTAQFTEKIIKQAQKIEEKLSYKTSSEMLEKLTSIIKKHEILPTGEQKMIVNIYPEEMGKIEIQVKYHEKRIETDLVVTTDKVRELIETNLNQLKENLDSKGLQLDRFDIKRETQSESTNEKHKHNHSDQNAKENQKREDENSEKRQKRYRQFNHNTFEYFA